MHGDDAFLMYDTYGFPLELTQEVAGDRGLAVDEEGFQAAMEQQRTRSKVRCLLVSFQQCSMFACCTLFLSSILCMHAVCHLLHRF